jgi:hypothetical protein
MRQLNSIIADCLDTLPRLPAASVNFVLTDRSTFSNSLAREGRTVRNDNNGAWLKPAFREIFRVLRDDSFCVSFYGWPQTFAFTEAIHSAGFRIAGCFVWPKPHASSVGIVRYPHESAFQLANGRPAQPFQTLPMFSRGSTPAFSLIPRKKPPSVLKSLVESFTRPGCIVLGPFVPSVRADAWPELHRH